MFGHAANKLRNKIYVDDVTVELDRDNLLFALMNQTQRGIVVDVGEANAHSFFAISIPISAKHE